MSIVPNILNVYHSVPNNLGEFIANNNSTLTNQAVSTQKLTSSIASIDTLQINKSSTTVNPSNTSYGTDIATTQFVSDKINALIGSSPQLFGTL